MKNFLFVAGIILGLILICLPCLLCDNSGPLPVDYYTKEQVDGKLDSLRAEYLTADAQYTEAVMAEVDTIVEETEKELVKELIALQHTLSDQIMTVHNYFQHRFDSAWAAIDSIGFLIDSLLVPDAPDTAMVTIEDSTFTVEWTPPEWTEGELSDGTWFTSKPNGYIVYIWHSWGHYDVPHVQFPDSSITLFSEHFVKNTTHWTCVTAYNIAGESAPSDTVMFEVK